MRANNNNTHLTFTSLSHLMAGLPVYVRPPNWHDKQIHGFQWNDIFAAFGAWFIQAVFCIVFAWFNLCPQQLIFWCSPFGFNLGPQLALWFWRTSCQSQHVNSKLGTELCKLAERQSDEQTYMEWQTQCSHCLIVFCQTSFFFKHKYWTNANMFSWLGRPPSLHTFYLFSSW